MTPMELSPINGKSSTPEPESAFEQSVRSLIDGISDLPSIPAVATKVNQLLSSPSSSAADLAKVISSDPSISAKVLRVVNSPFYGLSNKVTSINQAIVILGYRALRELVLGVSVMSALGQNSHHPAFDPVSFWRHSLAVGSAAKCLSRRLRLPGESEIYFTAGLLHDTGKMILSNHITTVFDQVASLVVSDNVSFIEAEHELYGSDHAFLGSVLFERWGLEPMLIQAVRFHHAPTDIPRTLEGMEAMTMPPLIHCADALAHLMFPDAPLALRMPDLYPEAFDFLESMHLKMEDLPQIMMGCHLEYTASKIFLGLREVKK